MTLQPNVRSDPQRATLLPRRLDPASAGSDMAWDNGSMTTLGDEDKLVSLETFDPEYNYSFLQPRIPTHAIQVSAASPLSRKSCLASHADFNRNENTFARDPYVRVTSFRRWHPMRQALK